MGGVLPSLCSSVMKLWSSHDTGFTAPRFCSSLNHTRSRRDVLHRHENSEQNRHFLTSPRNIGHLRSRQSSCWSLIGFFMPPGLVALVLTRVTQRRRKTSNRKQQERRGASGRAMGEGGNVVGTGQRSGERFELTSCFCCWDDDPPLESTPVPPSPQTPCFGS